MFKKDDVVVCVESGDYVSKGSRYKVSCDQDSAGVYKDMVEIEQSDRGQTEQFFAYRFQLVMKEEPKFKKGDKLKCINPKCRLTRGKIYEALKDSGKSPECHPDDTFVSTINDEGYGERFFITRFELYVEKEEKTMGDFKVGDKVKCVERSGNITYGDTYEITKFDSMFVFVTADDGREHGYLPSRFEFSGYKFKKGDSVKCIDPNGVLTEGKVYTVVGNNTNTYGEKFVQVVNNRGYTNDFYEFRFELAGVASEVIESSWTFEVTNEAQILYSEMALDLSRKNPVVVCDDHKSSHVDVLVYSSLQFKAAELDVPFPSHPCSKCENYSVFFVERKLLSCFMDDLRSIYNTPMPNVGGRRKVTVTVPSLQGAISGSKR